MISPFLRFIRSVLLTASLIGLVACGERQQDKSEASTESSPPPSSRPDRSPPSPHPNQGAPDLPIDPAEALAALTAANAHAVRDHLRSDSREWARLLGPFYQSWAALDPTAALLAAQGEGTSAFAATLHSLEGWTPLDPIAARDWVSAQPDPQRTRYARALIKTWPPGEFAELASWARDQPALLKPVALKWSSAEPSTALSWLGESSESPERSGATEAVFRSWARADPGAAGDYLLSHRDTPDRDAALSAYSLTVAPENLEAAERWAAQIQNEHLRAQVLAALPAIRPLPN